MYTRVTDESAWDVAILSKTERAREARPTAGKDSWTECRATGEESDGFEHAQIFESPYTDYAADGSYSQENESVLPPRYYEGTPAKAKVFYKGGSITYVGLLEEAVRTGEVTLDESKSVWENLEAAQKALIEDKATTLFPWSSALYSEDGQYAFRVENGRITGWTAAFCVVDGKRVSILDTARQIASGAPMSQVEGDTHLLMRLDPELYDAARQIGNAKLVFAQQTEWYENGEISMDRYLDELEPAMILLFGRKTGKEGIALMKRIFWDPEYDRKALRNFGVPASEWSDD